MSLATTVARLESVVDGVSGVGHVSTRLRTDTSREDVEAHMIEDGAINSWEITYHVWREWIGCGISATRMDVRIVALWKHDDANDSHAAFVTALDAVCEALMHPTTGFPQIDENGIQAVAPPDLPVKARTGHSAYRGEIAFSLLDVEDT